MASFKLWKKSINLFALCNCKEKYQQSILISTLTSSKEHLSTDCLFFSDWERKRDITWSGLILWNKNEFELDNDWSLCVIHTVKVTQWCRKLNWFILVITCIYRDQLLKERLWTYYLYNFLNNVIKFWIKCQTQWLLLIS